MNSTCTAGLLSAHGWRNGFFSLCPAVLAVVTLGLSLQAQEANAEEPNAACGPLFHEATNEFRTMTATLYQHQTRVNPAEGSYRFDCVGFVSFALKQAAPRAWETAFRKTGIPKGHIPSPPRYRAFFASLAENPAPGWDAVTRVSDLRPGDVVAWEHKTEHAAGHAVVVASVPTPGPDGEWSVEVYDSTSSPHSDDSRPGDPRAQAIGSNGRRSGLGHGVILLLADPASGALTGLRWSRSAKAVTVPIAAGRPTS